LFNAEPGSPIVDTMLARNIRIDKKLVQALKAEGILQNDIDVNLVSRRIAGAAWMNTFMWMKGFVALHEYETEYLRAFIDLLSAYATQKGREALRTRRPVS
ncbi:MAG: hypothetical protein HN816_05665, partial [Gammaproteobacteria bacterium]|nr:hypothetical protein [Gammaproteobacteria bacterium]